MARSLTSLSLALAGLLGAGAARSQSPASNTAEVQNPHSPDNAKRPGSTTPSADTDAAARAGQEANPHSTDNKDRAAPPGAGASATGAAEAGNPHSVKTRDHHRRASHHDKKDAAAKPTASPAPPVDGK